MVDYAQYPPSMPHDFELYSSNQEQHLDFHHNLPYVPASTYAMEHTFSASYDHMATLAVVASVPPTVFAITCKHFLGLDDMGKRD